MFHLEHPVVKEEILIFGVHVCTCKAKNSKV